MCVCVCVCVCLGKQFFIFVSVVFAHFFLFSVVKFYLHLLISSYLYKDIVIVGLSQTHHQHLWQLVGNKVIQSSAYVILCYICDWWSS